MGSPYSFLLILLIWDPVGSQNEAKIPSHPSPLPALWGIGQPSAATAARLGCIGAFSEQFRVDFDPILKLFYEGVMMNSRVTFHIEITTSLHRLLCIGVKNGALACARASSSSHAWAWHAVVVALNDFLERYVLHLPQSCGLE